jgi:hypothetical protein
MAAFTSVALCSPDLAPDSICKAASVPVSVSIVGCSSGRSSSSNLTAGFHRFSRGICLPSWITSPTTRASLRASLRGLSSGSQGGGGRVCLLLYRGWSFVSVSFFWLVLPQLGSFSRGMPLVTC